jgi:putative zinc finger/helix-turn-helix YgiT family protein
MFNFLCEECGKGKVRKHTIQNFATRIRGYPFVVPAAVVGVCDNCGAQVFDPQEMRHWSELFTAGLVEKGHLLTPQQIRSIREQLGLSIGDFARLIGSTRQSVYNWEREERKSPQTRLIDLFIKLIGESATSGEVDVIMFLQDQAAAVGTSVTVNQVSRIRLRQGEESLSLAPAARFDHLFSIAGSSIPLPTLRC